MGFGKRLVKHSVKRIVPRPVRKAARPVRTAKNGVKKAVIPKSVSRTSYVVRHPVGAAENKLIAAALPGGNKGNVKRAVKAVGRIPLPPPPSSARWNAQQYAVLPPPPAPLPPAPPPNGQRPPPPPVVAGDSAGYDGYSQVPLMPQRVTTEWLNENIPNLDEPDLEYVIEVLQSRGWTNERLVERVLPLVPWLDYDQ